MDFLVALFGESIELIVIVGLVKLIISALLIYLLIYFLAVVPDYLKDIAASLRKLSKRDTCHTINGKAPYIPEKMLVKRIDDGNDDED